MLMFMLSSPFVGFPIEVLCSFLSLIVAISIICNAV